ncbi:unnamed protein product [Adineta ricciae]|uniref:Uncharacterized protein n=1 Tax=Adineta ricciae TaxID=249248 RepID=A0A815U2N0_ADIRI|nr:unnamed protein product [Adineta ricciae]
MYLFIHSFKSCQTSNIIYALTCPCGQFDYTGESGYSLDERIQVHRYHGNRIMYECFMGARNFKLIYPNVVKSADTLSKDGMRLYRHSTECPTAIQIFLDENPQYWRFVPLLNDDADQMDRNPYIASRDVPHGDDLRSDKDVRELLANLPPPPANYRFSQRQYHQQYSFFQARRELKAMPNMHLDLYNAKVIAVLPDNGSMVLRRIIEALFITHAETKLNSAGCLVKCDHDVATGGSHGNTVWCKDLVRRPVPAFTGSSDMNNVVVKWERKD